jgi:hypothetical protein
MALLQNVLINEKTTERLSTRGLEVEKVVDLKSTFAHDTLVFTGSQAKLILDPAAHPMSGEHYFMYRYTYGNNEIARKKISFKGDTLIFDKKVLYKVNGQEIRPEGSSEVEIHKVNAASRSSMLIARFVPLFIPDEQLKAELEVIHTVMKMENMSEAAQLDTMYQHIAAVYGQTDKNMLKLWAIEHMFIHK